MPPTLALLGAVPLAVLAARDTARTWRARRPAAEVPDQPLIGYHGRHRSADHAEVAA